MYSVNEIWMDSRTAVMRDLTMVQSGEIGNAREKSSETGLVQGMILGKKQVCLLLVVRERGWGVEARRIIMSHPPGSKAVESVLRHI